MLVYKLDRLSRNVKDTLFLVKEIFTDNDIHFVSLKENIDTSSAMGSLFLTLLSAIAEFEREQIKERMMFGKLGRAKSGKTMSWTTSPYGYTYDKEQGKLIAIPSQAIVVKKLFDYYISGMSIANMLRKMNAEEQIGRTAEWSINAMKNILRNEVYYGMVKYRGQLFKGEHEPFISKKLLNSHKLKEKEENNIFRKNLKIQVRSKLNTCYLACLDAVVVVNHLLVMFKEKVLTVELIFFINVKKGTIKIYLKDVLNLAVLEKKY